MNANQNNQTTARIVGILFVIGTAAGILSAIFLGPFLDDPNYLVSISDSENQIIIGMMLILVMGFSLAMIPVMLYPIFKKRHQALALGAVVFRGALEAAVYIALGINWVLLLSLSREYVSAGTVDSVFLQAVGSVLLQADGWIGHILSIVFSLGAMMIYYMFYRSELIPRWLSGWGLIGAVLYFASPILAAFGSPLQFLELPLAIQEMVLAIWLIVKGFGSTEPQFAEAEVSRYRKAIS